MTTQNPHTLADHVAYYAKREREYLDRTHKTINTCLENGRNVTASDLNDLVYRQKTTALWAQVQRRANVSSLTTTEALTSVLTEAEKGLRDGPLMTSTNPTANAMGLVEREATIAVADKITGLLDMFNEDA